MTPKPMSFAKTQGCRHWWQQRRVRLGLLLGFGLLAYGINGPLSRWFLPSVVQHLVARQGYHIAFKLRGTWLAGPTIQDLTWQGGPLTQLKLKRLSIDAPWTFLRPRAWHHWEVEGLEAEINADALPTDSNHPHRDPFDPAAWVEEWQRLRPELLRHSLRVQTGKITLTRHGQSVVCLSSCQIRHEALDEAIDLQLGSLRFGDLTAPPTRWNSLPPQHITCRIRSEEISLNQLQIMPQLQLSNLSIATPRNRQLSAVADLQLLHSRWKLQVMPWLSSLQLQWQEGELDLATAANVFGETLPVQGLIRAAELRLRPRGLPRAGNRTEPLGLDADVMLRVQNCSYGDHAVDEITLDAQLQRRNGNLNLRARAGSAVVETRSQIEWLNDPLEDRQWWPAQVTTQVSSDAIAPWHQWWLSQTHQQTSTTNPSTASLPMAKLEAVLHWQGDETAPLDDCRAIWHAHAADPALSLHGSFTTSMRALAAPLRGSIQGANWASLFSVDRSAQTWNCAFSADELSSAALKPWLSWHPAVAAWPAASFSGEGEWHGQASTPRHAGQVAIRQFSWQREHASTVHARGNINFLGLDRWHCRDLRVEQGAQTIQLDAHCADNQLTLQGLQWHWNQQALLQATGTMPLPQMPWGQDDVKRFLSSTAPLDLTLQSQRIGMDVINEWLPPSQRLPLTGKVQLKANVRGTPQQPQITVATQAESLQIPALAPLQAFDVHADLNQSGERLVLNGEVRSAPFSTITFRASMPFRTAEWSQDLKQFAAVPLEGEVTLPPVAVATLAPLLPSAMRLDGTIQGNAKLSGTCSLPDFCAQVQLRHGSWRSPRREIPSPSEIAADVSWRHRAQFLRVENLTARLADGQIQGGGALQFDRFEPQHVQLSVQGRDLPLWRDGSALLRGHARLQVDGSWQQAHVNAAMQLQHGMIYRDIEFIPLATMLRLPIERHARAELDTPLTWRDTTVPSPFSQWTLEGRIDSSQPLLMRGNVLRGEATVNLIAAGTIGRPRLSGGMRVTHLEAQLPFSRLSVPSATVLFEPQQGLIPNLNLKGSSNVGHHDVSLYFFGPLSQPRYELTSSPPLPQHDIVSLLATGTTTDNLTQRNVASAKAAQLIVEEWRRRRMPFASALQPLISLTERFDLAIGDANPYTGKKYASASIALDRKNWFITGAVDAEGQTRSLLMFTFRFR